MESPRMKKIRLIRPFRAYNRGTVLDVPGGQAHEMILAGYAVEEKQRDLLDTATAEPEVRTSDATPKKRSRKQR
jgi:hypothetical protein